MQGKTERKVIKTSITDSGESALSSSSAYHQSCFHPKVPRGEAVYNLYFSCAWSLRMWNQFYCHSAYQLSWFLYGQVFFRYSSQEQIDYFLTQEAAHFLVHFKFLTEAQLCVNQIVILVKRQKSLKWVKWPKRMWLTMLCTLQTRQCKTRQCISPHVLIILWDVSFHECEGRLHALLNLFLLCVGLFH